MSVNDDPFPAGAAAPACRITYPHTILRTVPTTVSPGTRSANAQDRPRVPRSPISDGATSRYLDLVNGAAGFCDCGRMTIGELIEVLSELSESEDYDPASPVYLVSGNETTPRPLTEVEPDEDDDSLILIAV